MTIADRNWLRVGGMLNAIALAAFIAGTAGAAARGQRAASIVRGVSPDRE